MREKRVLPSWMVGASTINNASKPLDLDANDAITNEEVVVVTKSTNPKAKALTKKQKKEVFLPSNENSSLVKCERKRKKGEFVEEELINREQEVVEKRKRGRVGRKVEEPDCSRNEVEKNELESNNRNQDSSHDEEDEDLTMDDLLTFAKEIVENEDSNMVHQKPSEQQLETKSKSAYTSSSISRTSLSVPRDTVSPAHEETASRNIIKNSTSEVTLSDTRTTGDAAQDMLDLFLGPLLKKPIAKEDGRSSIKDIILSQEVKNRQQDAVISDKPVSFTKKKSSLRDAVAMFLD